MFKEEFHRQANHYLICSIAFLLPVHRMIASYPIALLILNYLLEGKFRQKMKLIIQQGRDQRVFLFALLYFLYIIGLIYTSEFHGQEGGFFDIQVKLSLFLFPFIFATLPQEFRSPEFRLKVLYFFLAGCILSFLICIVIGVIHFIQLGNRDVFYYTKLSVLLHPSYYSMYLNFAIVILVSLIIKNDYQILRNLKTLKILLIAIFVTFIVLLSSKAGLIGMIFIFFFTTVYYLIWGRMGLKAVVYAVIAAVFIITLLKVLPFSSMRMESIMNVMTQKHQQNINPKESTAERILIWKISWELIKENFILGVGTGDLKKEILKKYQEHGFDYAEQLHLNAHNQYFQTFITIGLAGITTLILSLILPLIFAFRTNDYVYFFFLLLIMLNFLVESMLETQPGVVFYSFFNAILFITSRKN